MQIEVLVISKESGEQRTMTYKSYLDLADRFTLVGQSDSEGNLIPGDPNLNPRHQKVQASDVVVPVVSTGMTMEEKIARKKELEERYTVKVEPVIQAPTIEEIHPEVKEKKKPGPKPKSVA